MNSSRQSECFRTDRVIRTSLLACKPIDKKSAEDKRITGVFMGLVYSMIYWTVTILWGRNEKSRVSLRVDEPDENPDYLL